MSGIITVTEVEVVTFIVSPPKGDKGDKGDKGLDGNTTAPSSVIINRTNGNISSLSFAGGKVVTINRVNGEIVSISDGTTLKTIIREDDEITEIVVT